jgi:hypothetical protein
MLENATRGGCCGDPPGSVASGTGRAAAGGSQRVEPTGEVAPWPVGTAPPFSSPPTRAAGRRGDPSRCRLRISPPTRLSLAGWPPHLPAAPVKRKRACRHDLGGGELGRIDARGDAEVGHLNGAVRADHDVAGLDVRGAQSPPRSQPQRGQAAGPTRRARSRPKGPCTSSSPSVGPGRRFHDHVRDDLVLPKLS